MSLIITSRSEDETMAAALRVAVCLRAGDLLALEGPLGAGKTCFVRGLAAALGLDPRSVSSPTFVISQEYVSAGRPTLIHIDAYRLHDPSELHSIGWDELLSRREAIIAIEWPSRIASALPADHVRIEFEHVTPTQRRVTLTIPNSMKSRFASLMAAGECPICRAQVGEGNPSAPFCSPRCRLADLNRWFTGKYQVSRPLDPQDEADSESL